jgi:CubicO group peptidase (beta-lactamase class C family)
MINWASTDRLLRDAVSGNIPGIVAGVTTRDGTAYLAAHGGIDQPAAIDDIFWIASMTKAITSIAAMQLVERGAVGLDEPLDHHAPELRNRQILEGFDAGGQPKLRPATRPLTLRHLLSHSSGAAENVWHAGLRRYIEMNGWPAAASGKRAALDLPLVGEPGTIWQYGLSHDLAALVIEAVSGQRLDQYFAEHIFAPLGMTDTSYEPSADRRERQAQLYARSDDGVLTATVRSLPPSREYMPGGGALNSTASDYLALIRLLLNGGHATGHQVLRPETVRQMAQSVTGDLAVSRLTPTFPGLSHTLEILEGHRKGWGLGFMVNLDDIAQRRRAHSLSWAGLSNCYYWIDPASGVGGVLMTQLLPFADPTMLALFDAFEAAVYADIAAA